MSESGPPPVPSGRSPEERERARREREARRTGRPVPGPASDGDLPTPPAPAKRVRPRREAVERRPLSGARRAVLAVAALVALILLWFVGSLFQPFKDDGGDQVRIVVPTGAGVGEIAELLEQRGVVSSSFFFELRATVGGRRGDLRPGIYRLREDMSYTAAIDALASGPPANLLNVTIPEGRSRREIAPAVERAGVDGSYSRASRRSRLLDPGDYGGRSARTLEGFLFPATYELRRGASARLLVGRQLQTFKREFRKVDRRAARRRNLNAYDVLTIASMVEREAQLPRERRLVASVIYNRLREGMPLGIDATVRFATGNWTRPLTRRELASRSPYNTRTRVGLPPGPIGNPGLASIQAAARPANTDFRFYVVKPNTCGEHAFSETLEEFDRDRARYNAERARRGGQSPTDC